MANLADFDLSVRMREAIYAIASEAAYDAYPRPRYGTVTAVNHAAAKVTIRYPDDATDVILSTTVLAPEVGAVVRVAGQPATRYIDEIQTGDARIRVNLNVGGNLSVAGAGSVTGTLTVTGTAVLGAIQVPNAGQPFMMIGNDAAWMGFYSAGYGARRGYLQGHGSGITLFADIGTVSISSAGGVNLGGNRIDFGAQNIQSIASITLSGNINFSAANPTLSASSYVQFPGGVYVSGGILYVAGSLKARGGISNDTAAALVLGLIAEGQCYITTTRASASDWSHQNLVVQTTSGTESGLAIYSPGIAPLIRTYPPFGERFDFLNSANTVYTGLVAGAFTVGSSQRIKKDIQEIEDDVLLNELIAHVRTHRFRLKVPQQTLRPSAKFTDIDNRWQAKGRKPLILPARYMESHDHDCAIDNCVGTAENPCMIAVNDSERYGLIAEHLHKVAPEAVDIDLEGLPAWYSVDQVAAMAFGGVGALLRKVQRLQERVDYLEGNESYLKGAA